MFISIVTWCAILFCFGGAFVLFSIHAYIAMFQAEKMRQRIIALPEYKSTWFYLVDLTKPFKWWHFYRRGLFSILLSNARMKARHKTKFLVAQKTLEVMPKLLKTLYRAETWSMIVIVIGMALTYFLQKYSG